MTASSEAPALQQDFRSAMRGVASSVAVVTVGQDDGRHGTTATAVTSLSMEPPSLLVCFNRGSRLHEKLHAAAFFCVNFVDVADVEIARVFSAEMPSDVRFQHGEWNFAFPAPVLRTSVASIICARDGTMTYGTHTVFVGRVHLVVHKADTRSLLYSNGAFVSTAPI